MGTHYGIRPQGNVSYKNTFYVLVDTNGRSDGIATVELNINESTGGDRYIDWGDGTVEVVNTELPSHTYASHGEYEIFAWGGTTTRLGQRGSSPNVGWTQTIKTVRCGSEFGFTNMQSAFYGFTGAELNVSSLNTTNVTNMGSMFNSCSSLTALDVSNFNTSSVKTMEIMFIGCSSLTDIIGIENFNISQVTKFNAVWGGQFITFALPTSRYDALLVNWDAQTVNSGLSVGFGNSQYTAGGAAEAARTSLITDDGWTITDGGSV